MHFLHTIQTRSADEILSNCNMNWLTATRHDLAWYFENTASKTSFLIQAGALPPRVPGRFCHSAGFCNLRRPIFQALGPSRKSRFPWERPGAKTDSFAFKLFMKHAMFAQNAASGTFIDGHTNYACCHAYAVYSILSIYDPPFTVY